MKKTLDIRIGGRVQGVGFRPHVWRLARDLGLDGTVMNDSAGVLVRARGAAGVLEAFVRRLRDEAPPLAQIASLEATPADEIPDAGFAILESRAGAGRTELSPDFATCDACRAEILDPAQRRHGYAFSTCTHCGPRLTIVTALPYDRRETTLAPFPLCAACRREYENPADRRFHAEAMACPACGPTLVYRAWNGDAPAGDPLDAAARLLRAGGILAIKALGGYQLACDATDDAAVAALRAGKRRDGKPFALMARDLAAAEGLCTLSANERAALTSREAPIVLLDRKPGGGIAAAVAPGLATLGVMLPSNPLQILLAARLEMPLVMTSGNLSGSPQIIGDAEAEARLSAIAGGVLTHDRAIASRIDDSVARGMGGAIRLIRRGRGYAPASFPLPPGFAEAPDLVAFGADMKAAFCLLAGGKLVLSQHIGDLDEAETATDFTHFLGLYRVLHALAPRLVAGDLHPEYRASRLAEAFAEENGLPRLGVQHHHAHLAACLGENRYPADGPPVLGIVLDGFGLGGDGEAWGGEFLVGSYHDARRAGRLRPAPLPGGDQAAREPWRNLFAWLSQGDLWPAFERLPAGHPLRIAMAGKPLKVIGKMLENRINSPLSSSMGRLFDAVAAALGAGFERQGHEGEAAGRLEALVGARGKTGYPFAICDDQALLELDPAPMWHALLTDLVAGVAPDAIAARFHVGLAAALAAMASRITARDALPRTVALSGGCFQNRVLFEETAGRLEEAGFTVLSHREVPANDGGIAFGQALVAAARCGRS